MAHGHACWSMCLRAVAKDRHNNNWALVADAASIRADAGSVGHDSDCCADPNPDFNPYNCYGGNVPRLCWPLGVCFMA